MGFSEFSLPTKKITLRLHFWEWVWDSTLTNTITIIFNPKLSVEYFNLRNKKGAKKEYECNVYLYKKSKVGDLQIKYLKGDLVQLPLTIIIWENINIIIDKKKNCFRIKAGSKVHWWKQRKYPFNIGSEKERIKKSLLDPSVVSHIISTVDFLSYFGNKRKIRRWAIRSHRFLR